MSKRLAAMAEADIAGGRNPGKKAGYLRVLNRLGRWNGDVYLDYLSIEAPLSWATPRVIFVNSMSDLFHEAIYGQSRPWRVGTHYNATGFEFLLSVWSTMRKCPQHGFRILTKRPEVMADLVWRVMAKLNMDDPLANVWLGTSAEDQPTADKRIRQLLKCPAAAYFISFEPLLGPIKIADCVADWWESRYRPMVIIVGAESGPGARPMDLAWARALRDETHDIGGDFFMKQICDSKGRKIPFDEWPDDLRIREWPEVKP